MKKYLMDKKLIISALTLIVVLATAIRVTYSWFTNNKEDTSNGMAFEIDASVGVTVMRYDIYKRDGALGARNVKDEPSIEMTEYDTIFTDRNVDTPIIIRVVLSDIPAGNPDIILSVGASGYWTITEKDGATDPEEIKSGNLYNDLSNLATVRFGLGSAELDAIDPDDAPAMYDGAVSHLEGNVEQLNFAKVATYSSAGKIKYRNVSKDARVYGIISDYTPVNGKIVLYTEITYSDELVAAYIDQNGIVISEDKGVGLDSINFVNDLGAITFEFDTEELD